jgi:PGF-pre-PGF domain-containing protein
MLNQVGTQQAADIMTNVVPTQAGKILVDIPPTQAGNIMSQVSPVQAANIMEQTATTTLTGVIAEMSETSLIERLPGLTPDKLHSIPAQTLFDSMPSAPVEMLTTDTVPEPPPEATAPVYRGVLANGHEYVQIKTFSGEWVTLIATPFPLDKLLLKTKTEVANLVTNVNISEQKPANVTALPAGDIVRSYFDISTNASADAIDIGHLTFKVEKKWLESNKIQTWSVALKWYDIDLKQWVALPTKIVNEDAELVYYGVVITHFSNFAIVGNQTMPKQAFEVTGLKVNPSPAVVGEKVSIIAEIANKGDAGVYVATLWINNTVESGQNIALAAGETKQVVFSFTGNKDGIYHIRVDRQMADLTVQSPAAFTASALTINLASVKVGETANVTVNVKNSGGTQGTFKVDLKVNGSVEQSKEVTLDGGESSLLSFNVTKETAGIFQVEINGMTGSFTVTPLSTGPNWGIIAIIAGAIIIVAIAAWLLLRRRTAS